MLLGRFAILLLPLPSESICEASFGKAGKIAFRVCFGGEGLVQRIGYAVRPIVCVKVEKVTHFPINHPGYHAVPIAELYAVHMVTGAMRVERVRYLDPQVLQQDRYAGSVVLITLETHLEQGRARQARLEI